MKFSYTSAMYYYWAIAITVPVSQAFTTRRHLPSIPSRSDHDVMGPTSRWGSTATGSYSGLIISTSTILRVSDSTSSKLHEAPPSENDNGEAVDGENASNRASGSSSLPTAPVSKFRKLKDIMWIREAVEDVTAAEFATAVESGSEGETNERLRRKRKRAVDYEKMLTNLNRRVADMVCEPIGDEEGLNGGSISLKLMENQGMGRFACNEEQREELLKQILKTRSGLVEIMKGHRLEEAASEEDENGLKFELPEIPELHLEIPKEEESTEAAGPKLYVRDDGTVDWEGALQDRAALRKFGGAVWARINGQLPSEDEDSEDESEKDKKSGQGDGEKPAVTAKIEETPAIREAREELNRLQSALKEKTRAHTTLLSSGILEGQAVANVRLASLSPVLRTKIRFSAEALQTMEQQVSYQSLVYELERIYTYLATELGNPSAKGYVPLPDRLNVAEYGLLEGQVENCIRELNTKGSLDADIVAVIADQMSDFKRRLGIDYYVTGLTYDREAIQTWLADITRKTKSGLMFYVKGCRLFWNDLVYCSTLIARAAQGYTLKPREVRTIRRTFKDIITFIPVVIILIIPLSPVGHVLVFGAIQRFFPDFFPSCFTEQRQNLLQLYETTEYSEFVINENFQERFTRFLEAGAFLMASKSKELYVGLTTQKPDTDQSRSDEI